MCVRGNAHMKGNKIIRMPKRQLMPPPGYFLAVIGETIYCFDAEGNKKPRAEVPIAGLPKEGASARQSETSSDNQSAV